MTKVAVVRLAAARYPEQAPYHPSESYPEYPFGKNLSQAKNLVYEGVRWLLSALGLDAGNFGTSKWNPLGSIIKPGMTVVIKPNFVVSRHKEGKDLFAAITHASVLRAVGDYSWIALRGEGRLIFADAPQYDCNFAELLESTRLTEVSDFYARFKGPGVEVLDLRTYWSNHRHFPSMLRALPGDPEGNVVVNLGRRSALYGRPSQKLYGAVYHRQELIAHHHDDRHEYQVAGTMMKADVVVSVPKLKVHKKVGVTLNAKGLVGITTNKNHLVHYTLTSPKEGGDQYPDGYLSPVEERLIKTERWMYDHLLARRSLPLEYLHRSVYWLHGKLLKPFGITVPIEKRLLDAGNWWGNDSAWRMVVDLLNIFYYAGQDGKFHDTPQRKMFTFIDGVIGGENVGPLVPDPKSAGVLLAGENLLATDLVATRLMGFDPMKMRMYSFLLKESDEDYGFHSLDEIEVVASPPEWSTCLGDPISRFLNFKPHPGWIGHVEMEPTSEEHP
ncbi:MAG: DUF362 domain-containing protein [Terriglobia bacterium]